MSSKYTISNITMFPTPISGRNWDMADNDDTAPRHVVVGVGTIRWDNTAEHTYTTEVAAVRLGEYGVILPTTEKAPWERANPDAS